jgi:hypothetical protein
MKGTGRGKTIKNRNIIYLFRAWKLVVYVNLVIWLQGILQFDIENISIIYFRNLITGHNLIV